MRYDLSYVDKFSVSVLRLVIPAVGAGNAGNGYAMFRLLNTTDSGIELLREVSNLGKIFPVRTTRTKGIRKRMLTSNGSGGNSGKPCLFQYVAQFYERIVKISVSESYKRHGHSADAFYCIKISEKHIGNSSGIGGNSKDYKVTLLRVREALTSFRKSEIVLQYGTYRQTRH